MNQAILQRFVLATGLCLCFAFGSAVQREAAAQEESEMIRQYPASHIAPNLVKLGISQVDWRLKSLAMQRSSLENEIQRSHATIKSIESTMENMSMQLPIETRFVDASSRSKIAGQALEALLSAKLDLVVVKAQIAGIEKRKSTVQHNKQQQSAVLAAQISLKAARAEFDKEEKNLERSSKLFEKGFLPQRELDAAEFSHEIAALKIQKAEADLAMTAEKQMGSDPIELADLRLHAAPLEARIKAAEDFLQTFVDANQGQAKIDALDRQRNQVIERTRWLEQRQFELDMQITELNTLKQMVDESGSKKTEDADTEAKH